MKLTSNQSDGKGNAGLFIAVPVCLVLAILFSASILIPSDPEVAVEKLDTDWYTPKTARNEILKNKVMVGNCFLCHAYWVGIPDPQVIQPRFAHHVIKLDHGTNDRCYNCHLIQDRNKYTANNGTGIITANVEHLCARCHGLIYNDWKQGTHGVRRGKWSAKTEFEAQNFICTECHNPHSPKFEFKEYAPPPIWPKHFVRRNIDEFQQAVALE